MASAQKVRAVADYSLAECPKLDVILVPGGMGTRREVSNETLLALVRQRSSDARVVTSVCTGAALLARAGLQGAGAARLPAVLAIDRLLATNIILFGGRTLLTAARTRGASGLSTNR